MTVWFSIAPGQRPCRAINGDPVAFFSTDPNPDRVRNVELFFDDAPGITVRKGGEPATRLQKRAVAVGSMPGGGGDVAVAVAIQTVPTVRPEALNGTALRFLADEVEQRLRAVLQK